jgi:oligosaccharide repeat unit polymerase
MTLMLAAYLVNLTLLTAGSVYVSQVRREGGRQLELTPSMILPISYFLYSSALPISRLFFGSPAGAYDMDYLMPHLMGAAGILIGLILANPVFAKTNRVKIPTNAFAERLRVSVVAVVAGAAIIWQLYVMFSRAEWSLEMMLSPYGVIEQSSYTAIGLAGILTTIGSNILVGTLVLAAPGMRSKPLGRRVLFVVVVLVACIFIIRGNRNIAGMLVLPIIAMYMYGLRIRPFPLIASLVLIVVFLYSIGVVRNFGFKEIERAMATVEFSSAFDPLNGELGTSYSVFSKWHQLRFGDDYLLGQSYHMLVIANIIPRALWPERPRVLSESLSMQYYNTATIGWGLGFSPVVEAVTNFGFWGIIPIIALFALAVRRLEQWLPTRGPAGLVIYGFLVPFVMNWNRIDMATNVKMLLLFVVITVLLKSVYYIAHRRAARP